MLPLFRQQAEDDAYMRVASFDDLLIGGPGFMHVVYQTSAAIINLEIKI